MRTDLPLVKLILLLLSVSVCYGQGDVASLSGVVLDPAGQPVGGARVRVAWTGRQRTAESSTTDAGLFRLPSLPTGRYSLAVEKEGFHTWLADEILLLPGQDLNVTVWLQLAAVTDSIVVSDSVAEIDREARAGSRGASYTPVEVRSAPILTTNVGRNYRALAYQTPGVGFSRTSHAPFTVNGNRSIGATNTMVDSAEYNDVYSGNLLGRGMTEQPVSMEAVEAVQIQTSNFKAEYGRATGAVVNLVTRRGSNEWHGSLYGFFQNEVFNARNPLLAERAPLRLVMPGYTLGGPLKRDRLFLFSNFETAVRNAYRASSTIQTLTAEQRARAVPAVQPLLQYYPLPNIPGANLHSQAIPSPTTTPTGVLRLDHDVTPSQRLSGRLNFVQNNGMLRERLWGGNAASANRSGSAVLSLDSSAAARLFNQARLTYSRFYSFVDPLYPSLGDPAVNGQAGLISVVGLPLLGQFRHRSVTSFHTFTAADDITFLRGAHMIKTGFVYRLIQANNELDRNFNGTLVFPSVDAFLAGQPVSYTRAIGASRLDMRAREAGLYWQDDWRILPALTLNLGLRYEYFTVPSEKYNRIGSLYRPDRNNFAPRVGLAWSLPRLSSTVLRGGYGIFYSPLPLSFVGQARFAPPLITIFSRTRPAIPDLLAGASVGSDVHLADSAIRNPYVQNWNLTLDRQIGNTATVFSLAYVGNRGIRLPATSRPNGGENLPAASRPDPARGVVSYLHGAAASTYHSMQLSVRSAMGPSLSWRAAYTFSRSIDSASDSDFVPIDERNWRLDRAVSDFHQPHLLTLLATYDLPSLGPRFLLSGWQLSNLVLVRSGTPFSILANTNNPTGTLNNRIHDVPGTLVRSRSGTARIAFSPGITPALLQPAPGEVGTLGRNTERAPGFAEWNVGLQREFRLTESAAMQLRVEAFNLLNRANYDLPINNIANAAFGRVLTSADGRQLQWLLRFSF